MRQGRWRKMTVSYKKLWKILIDLDMKKKDLQAKAGISPSSISKLSKLFAYCSFLSNIYFNRLRSGAKKTL